MKIMQKLVQQLPPHWSSVVRTYCRCITYYKNSWLETCDSPQSYSFQPLYFVFRTYLYPERKGVCKFRTTLLCGRLMS